MYHLVSINISYPRKIDKNMLDFVETVTFLTFHFAHPALCPLFSFPCSSKILRVKICKIDHFRLEMVSFIHREIYHFTQPN